MIHLSPGYDDPGLSIHEAAGATQCLLTIHKV